MKNQNKPPIVFIIIVIIIAAMVLVKFSKDKEQIDTQSNTASSI